MEFLRKHKLEIHFLIPKKVACVISLCADLIVGLTLLVSHNLQFYQAIQKGYMRGSVISGILGFLSVLNLVLALNLFTGLKRKTGFIRKAQVYILGWALLWIASLILFVLTMVFYLPLHKYEKEFGHSVTFIIQAVLYPILIFYKPFSLAYVNAFILEILRRRKQQDKPSITRQEQTRSRDGIDHNPSRTPGSCPGTPYADRNRRLQPPTPTTNPKSPSPTHNPFFPEMCVQGVEDLMQEVEFPTDLQISSEDFQISQEEPLKVEQDYFIKKGFLLKGMFGRNIKNPKQQVVALKIYRQNVNVEAVRRMLLETKILTLFKDHSSVIQLLAFCADNIHKGKLTLLFDFCEGGTLADFLREHYIDFQDLIVEDTYELKKDPPALSGDKTVYENVMMSGLGNSERNFVFNSKTLLSWSLQAANGMDFINGKGVVHGNLRALHCIVDDHFRVRIGNFTFATQLFYFKQTQIPIDFTKIKLPYRWIALECMKRDPPSPHTFTEMSDVWSYGVLLWETFSMGCTPYEGLETATFFPKLMDGERLEKPTFATSEIYQIMLDCWHSVPEKRPTFAQIKATFQKLLQDLISSSTKAQSDG